MRSANTRLIAFAAVVSLIAVVSSVGLAPTAKAAAWAPASSAAIHPGVQTFTKGAQCTANFIFTEGSTVYIGQAAHCASTGGATETNGCTAGTLPLGTAVTVTGASHPGVIVYSSWVTMQALHETDHNTCAFNDLALIQLDPADVAKVNPSIPTWGGPVGLNTAGAPLLSRVYSYGNSELRLGLTLLSPKEGVSLGDTGDGWEHEVSTVMPGIPGDSGSAFLDAHGRALGILSTLQLGATGASNGIGDLSRELTYAHSHGGPAATLVLGTVSFKPNALPLGSLL